ncbi:hypothetical protein PAPYR_9747 [Paratrimastix pyriformis]|uniref:Uncharacterized protein n=1 Tax=Paratrimastix pyriformis TaxID=342808 RepID=A0ABQ8U7Q7_9EUKA|nr:hypothetical protein PAPYR_9747 [Paratrimastix pyriformis]
MSAAPSPPLAVHERAEAFLEQIPVKLGPVRPKPAASSSEASRRPCPRNEDPNFWERLEKSHQCPDFVPARHVFEGKGNYVIETPDLDECEKEWTLSQESDWFDSQTPCSQACKPIDPDYDDADDDVGEGVEEHEDETEPEPDEVEPPNESVATGALAPPPLFRKASAGLQKSPQEEK